MNTITHTKNKKRTGAIHRVSYLLLSCMLAFGLALMGCEGPQGPQGEQGLDGSVGPAGEDGSMMYSGQGAPDADIGEIEDYYLDTDTGEMYGPKDSDGWGNPIIVLMGEDGQDGEDGSQIHSGSGAPDGSLGAVGDYYLDEDNYDLYGPKTSSGWGSPLNLKGADGNANVTRYLYSEHDFSEGSASACMETVSKEEMREDAWLYYLMQDDNQYRKYSVPGWAHNTAFDARILTSTSPCDDEPEWYISTAPGEDSDRSYEIMVVQIKASNTVDNRILKQKGGIIPDHLDVSNYEEVAEYYGFNR